MKSRLVIHIISSGLLLLTILIVAVCLDEQVFWSLAKVTHYFEDEYTSERYYFSLKGAKWCSSDDVCSDVSDWNAIDPYFYLNESLVSSCRNAALQITVTIAVSVTILSLCFIGKQLFFFNFGTNQFLERIFMVVTLVLGVAVPSRALSLWDNECHSKLVVTGSSDEFTYETAWYLMIVNICITVCITVLSGMFIYFSTRGTNNERTRRTNLVQGESDTSGIPMQEIGTAVFLDESAPPRKVSPARTDG